MKALGDKVGEGEPDRLACAIAQGATLLAAGEPSEVLSSLSIKGHHHHHHLHHQQQQEDQVQRPIMRRLQPARQYDNVQQSHLLPPVTSSKNSANLLLFDAKHSQHLQHHNHNHNHHHHHHHHQHYQCRQKTSRKLATCGAHTSRKLSSCAATSCNMRSSSGQQQHQQEEVANYEDELQEKRVHDEDGGNCKENLQQQHKNDGNKVVEWAANKVRPPNKWRARRHFLVLKQQVTHTKYFKGNQKSIVNESVQRIPINANRQVLTQIRLRKFSPLLIRKASMWPTWRKIVILSFLSVLLASLLTNLNILSQGASTSTCLLFNHCHALSVRQTVNHSGVVVSGGGSRGGNSNSSSSSELASPVEGGQTKQVSSQRPSLSAILMPSTTTVVSTASMNAPTRIPAVSTQSSITGSPVERSSNNRSQTSNNNQESSVQNQHRYHQNRFTQLAEPNRSVVNTAADLRGDESPGNLLASGRDNNGQLAPFDNNYHHYHHNQEKGEHRRVFEASDAANNNNNGSQRASSITRAESTPGSSLALASSGEEGASGSTSNKRRNQQQQHLSATNSVPIQSSRGSIRLIGSPALVQLAAQASQTLSAGGISSAAGKFELNQQQLQHQQQQQFKPLSNLKESLPALNEGWSVIQHVPGPNQQPVHYSSRYSPVQSVASGNMAANETAARIDVVSPAPMKTSERFASADPLSHKADQVTDQSQPMLSPQPNNLISSQTHLSALEAAASQRSAANLHNIADHQLPTRQQFLVSAGLAIPPSLLQSLVRNALTDLVANSAAGEQIIGAASHAQPLVLRGPLSPLFHQLANQMQNNGENQQLSLQLNDNNNKQSPKTAASASAPSISLPPLSHFLVPRNPFRLFSSSSTPVATRYRPSFMAKSVGKFGYKSNNNNNNNNKANSQPVVTRWNFGSQPSAIDMSASIQNQFRAPAYQGTANLLGLDDILSTAAGSDSPGQSGSLYAHSHSAEQLERLVRAASQASGVHSPILPAIVSAPNGGAFPGFYIPAVESESESQVNEFRHGSGGSDQSIISSKIPGTDYILHPDEVRAMINIGELAWRKQQTNTEGDKQQQVAATNHFSGGAYPQEVTRFANQQSDSGGSSSESRSNWRFLENQQQQQQQQHHLPGQHQFDAVANLMKENHAENARDFAYVDPQTTHDQFQAASHSSNSRQQPPIANSPPNSTVELASQLSNHFKENQVNAFPAIIRVNDQDYVHWPLIKFRQAAAAAAAANQQDQQQMFRPPNSAEESRKHYTQFAPFQAAGIYQAKLTPYQRGHLFAIAAHPTQLSSSNTSPTFHQQRYNNNNYDNNQQPTSRENNFQHYQQSFGDRQVNTLNQMAANQQVNVQTGQQQPPVKGGPQMNDPQPASTNQYNQAGFSGQIPIKLRSNLPDLDHSPVRLATQLTSQEVRQVEDSIIEALLMTQALQQQRHLAQTPVNNQRLGSNSNERIHGNNHDQLDDAGSLKKSKFKTGFFRRRRRRRHSNTLNNGATHKRLPQIAPVLMTAPSEPFGTVPLLNVSSLSMKYLPTPTMVQFSHLDLVHPLSSSQMIPHEAKSRLMTVPTVVMADQETNKPNLLDGGGSAKSGASVHNRSESMSAEATVPKATFIRPPKQVPIDEGQSTMAFGSRVPRLSSPATSSASGGLPMRSSLRTSSLDTDLLHVTPLKSTGGDVNRHSLTNAIIKHQAAASAAASSDGPPPAVTASAAAKAHLIELVPTSSNKPRQQSARASGINRINVDWPAMVSDADYFPDPNQQRDHLKAQSARQVPKQVSKPESAEKPLQADGALRAGVQVSSAESRQVFDDGQPKRRHQTRTSGSLSLNNNYAPSQLKLQFAQDYQAREGVPIYNNNVRVAGALDRVPSLMERGESVSHNQQHHHNRLVSGSSNQTPPKLDIINGSSLDDESDAEEADESSPAESARPSELKTQLDRQAVAESPAADAAGSTMAPSVNTTIKLSGKPIASVSFAHERPKLIVWRRETPKANWMSVGSTRKLDAH